MRKALVSGAGGFIGGHLVKKLKGEGYWVRGVDIKEHEFATTQADEFLLLPILPHLSQAYTLVLPARTEVSLRVSTTYQATLSIDGNINLPLESGTVVSVRRSEKTTRFLRIHPEKSFYSSLEQRLKGKKIH